MRENGRTYSDIVSGMLIELTWNAVPSCRETKNIHNLQ